MDRPTARRSRARREAHPSAASRPAATSARAGSETPPAGHAVGIVGVGPKGAFACERLAAELRARPLSAPVELHLFNRSEHFAAGGIYHPGQPGYLLVNIGLSAITFWTDDEPPAVVAERPRLLDYLARERRPPLLLDHDDVVPRALLGEYLEASFARLLAHLPPGLTVRRHVGEVLDVEPRGGRYAVRFAAPGREPAEVLCDKLLFATGHSRNEESAEQRRCRRFAARRPGRAFIPYVYPVEETLLPLPATARVAFKGMALTFIDALLALTEGKGGRFERRENGGLRYRPSGGEPERIVAYSRSGLPIVPRARHRRRRPPAMRFLTPRAIAALRRARSDGKIDFSGRLWPLIEREMRLAHARALMRGTPWARRLARAGDDWPAVAELIARFHDRRPEAPSFALEPLLDPTAGRVFADLDDYRDFIRDYLRAELAQARLGNAASPQRAAVEVWRDCGALLIEAMGFGGLTPASHRDLERRVAPAFERLTFGPPLANAEKLLALLEAGIWRPLGPGTQLQTDGGGADFVLVSPATGGTRIAVSHLVDARIPKFSVGADRTPLYRSLRRRRLVRPFVNAAPDDGPYATGAVAISRRDCFVLGRDGRPNPDLTVVGMPTEGILIRNDSILRTNNNYAGIWAANVVAQLRRRERAAAPPALAVAGAEPVP
ncbi:MAG: hypothetical protein D6696_14055 [Acidobacteria bacterium]|nr:MAG: hypothetical protein D6696_14055 [Acidobacteriota bacterium]